MLKIRMLFVVVGIFCTIISALGEGMPAVEALKSSLSSDYAGRAPREWSENVRGVRTRLMTNDKVIALTLDACGSAKGKGYDRALIEFLIRERIPATLFMNARWIDANPAVFRELAANPLFEIANHGLLHKPASVTGRSVYGIKGTAIVAELVDEIEGNAIKIMQLTGNRPRYYRSGTAYYDEIAVEISQRMKHEVIGFSILGDTGATLPKNKLRNALLPARGGYRHIAYEST